MINGNLAAILTLGRYQWLGPGCSLISCFNSLHQMH